MSLQGNTCFHYRTFVIFSLNVHAHNAMLREASRSCLVMPLTAPAYHALVAVIIRSLRIDPTNVSDV